MTDKTNSLAIHFEAIQIGMSKDKNGFVLKLIVHPNDVPKDLIEDWVGTRYMVAMVKIGDDDQPVPPTRKTEGEKAVQIAGALCRNEKFQRWLANNDLALGGSEEAAVAGVRTYCKINSRNELATDEKARAAFYELRSRFEEALRRKVL